MPVSIFAESAFFASCAVLIAARHHARFVWFLIGCHVLAGGAFMLGMETRYPVAYFALVTLVRLIRFTACGILLTGKLFMLFALTVSMPLAAFLTPFLSLYPENTMVRLAVVRYGALLALVGAVLFACIRGIHRRRNLDALQIGICGWAAILTVPYLWGLVDWAGLGRIIDVFNFEYLILCAPTALGCVYLGWEKWMSTKRPA